MDTNSIPATPPPSTADSIFLGRFGLRAGWSALIFVAIFIVLLGILSVAALAATGKLKSAIADAIAQSHAPKNTSTAQQDVPVKDTAIGEAVQFGATALATLALALIERRRLAVYGISRARLHDFLPGAFWGLACLSLLVAVLSHTHVLIFDARALHGSAVLVYGLKWLLVFLFVGLFEEYLNRGFLQFTLTRGLLGLAQKISSTHARAIAFWIAALIMSVIFGAGHLFNTGENPMGLVMVFVAGIVFSYALWRTGSLWWAIGFHMAWDWAQSFLYGVPDSGQLSAGRLFFTHPTGKTLLSGGVDGPEGSIYVLPVMLLVLLIVRFTTKPGPQPPLEQKPSPQPTPLFIT